jgi:ribosome biogenesis GTPase / thiamine phosphate phosphatase
MRSRELGRRGVVVGDRVAIVGDVSGAPDALARIVRVESRTSVLRRSADDDDPIERVIVANADRLVIVTSLADPPPRPRLIDRCLVAAFDAGISSLLCITKADLAAPDELLAAYAPMGLPAVVLRRGDDDDDLDELRRALGGEMSVLVGHSGVGKSTLVNRLLPGVDRATGAVNATTGRGRHTSSSAVALPFPGGGWVIDTPGVRSFGLGHVRTEHLLAAFPDLAPAAENCPHACSHLADAPGCALDDWVATGHAEPARLDSLRRLLESRAGAD